MTTWGYSGAEHIWLFSDLIVTSFQKKTVKTLNGYFTSDKASKGVIVEVCDPSNGTVKRRQLCGP